MNENLVLVVEDTFARDDGGLIVTGNVPGQWVRDPPLFLIVGTKIKLVRPNGTIVLTEISGIEFFTEPLSRPYGGTPVKQGVGLLFSNLMSPMEAPIGTLVCWE